MTKALEILDLPDTGQVRLGLNNGQDRRAAPPAPFQDPLDESDHREIYWYFQDFLADPFGPSKPRAEAVETGLRSLGRLLFEMAIQGNQEAQGYYTDACEEGLSGYQLVIISSRPEFLGLPWELLNEPDSGYLAPRFASLVRRTSVDELSRFDLQLSTGQFNVLLVSPLPAQLIDATNDPSISCVSGAAGSLANEALSALESLDVEVELDCVRPPTYQALAECLERNPGRYHLVHLDAVACNDSGELLFESQNGAGEPVDPSRVGELLAKASVPIVLLNGTGVTSSSVGNPWASAAAGIAEAGIPFVVSVPFPLAAPARSSFVRHLYEQIVKGEDLPAVVAQARQALMDDPQRPSPGGNLVFWDWITPTVYQSREYEAGAVEVNKPDPLTPPGQQAPTGVQDQVPQGGPYGLVGRRSELRHLERMFQHEPVVLMWGNTGIGKSELALGLAGWFQKTGARPGGVFYTSFEVGAGVERVVHEIGTAVAGLDFADMNAQRQKQWVVEYLREQPSLLIWDGLQNVGGFSGTESAGILDDAEREDLDSFLAEVVTDGQSSALLVSRSQEASWITTPHTSFQLTGLGRNDRLELACKVQETAGLFGANAPERGEHHLGPDYLELLDMIDGHPLGMQIALPLLKDVPASVLMGELRSRVEEATGSEQADGRDPLLTALMDYSFSRMSRRSRAHLPFLSLFQRRVMMDILTHITQERVYRTVMGEELGWGACRTLLRSARDAGFLEGVTPSVYQIHPTYPRFYGQRLSRQVPASGIRQLEQEFIRVYADTADYFMETLYENQDSGTMAVLAEEGNLTQALGLALEDQQWDTAQLLVQPLAQVYRMQKRYPELRRLRRQLLQTVTPDGGGATEAEGKGAIDLWLYLLGTE
ncbi:MAG: ATP-binding protein, partial [Chloroflexi bacterium]|nr:ATP-binding protein [Chloroflexota bacterium]